MSPSQDDIVRIALERAVTCLEGVEDLIRETRGNQYTLQRAAKELHDRIESSDSPESIALELVAAAYRRMTGSELEPGGIGSGDGDEA